MRTTAELALTPLWRVRPETLSFDERVRLSYERCKSVVQTYKLTGEEIMNMDPRYWEFHTDPILLLDFAVGTLLTIHYNLCAGTLAMYASGRPDVAQILDKLLRYEWSGQYCLTELGHGLDVINMETTATLLPSGEFELNTPVDHAAKYMPPTSPCGYPVVAVVFARLIVGGQDRGIKPFVVNLSDGYDMTEGITCKIITPRGGARPVKHALTYFDRVRLPTTALLGTIERAKDQRAAFYKNIYRVISGCLSMGAFGLSTMRISSYIAGHYSLRRKVVDASTKLPRPIITFSTQYIPILTALSQTFVMEAYSNRARDLFVAAKEDIYKQHFIAAIFKTTIIRFAQSTPLILGDRCGAQGLSEVNQLSVMHADTRGAAIAEGDVLAISIRFGMEVLLGRTTPPLSTDINSLLFKHEDSMISELRALLQTGSGHRDPKIDLQVLSQCQPLIEAIGHRMAYDSAIQANLDRRLIDLFIVSVMKLDPAWYSENAGLPRVTQAKMEGTAAASLLPKLSGLLEALDTEEYVTAPIVSDKAWNKFVDSLETVSHVGESHNEIANFVLSRL